MFVDFNVVFCLFIYMVCNVWKLIILELFILKYIVNMSWNDYSNVGSNNK